MAVSMRQSLRLGAYLAKQKLARREKFPLVVELEPLFACNLACAGCGKIQYPANILKQRMPVETAVAAIEECGAPMVSIAGGEPLIHPEIHEIVAELIKRKKFVYLCTNALLMKKKMDRFKPSPYFAWAVHMDGLRERHDKSVCQEGVFDAAVDAIKEAKRRGFRVTTSTSSASRRPPSCSARPSPTGTARSGASTTRRCSSTSSKARSITSAPPGASRATRSSAGKSPAT